MNSYENTSSTIGEDLKIDPHYSWVLKDLEFNNNKRVIDVTKILDDNSEQKEQHEHNEADSNNIKSNIGETLLDDASSYEKTDDEDEEMLREQLTNVLANQNYQSVDTNVDFGSTSEQKTDEDNDEDDPDDARMRESIQKMQKNYLHILKNQVETSSDEAVEKKTSRKIPKTRKFSRSFEVSLSDLDDRIDRLDNEIKLKRHNMKSNEQKQQNIDKKQEESSSSLFTDITKTPRNETKSNQDVIETLKNEWSQVFNKLEEDYKKKLDEQQRINEEKLKKLYDEIKESINIKQQKSNEQVNEAIQANLTSKVEFHKSSDDEIENYTISSSSIQFNPPTTTVTANITESQSCSHNVESLVQKIDNAQTERKGYIESIKEGRSSAIPHDSKYISNLRLTLKTKHARHIQDLKSYYEQEIEDLRNELLKAQNKLSTSIKPFISPKKMEKLTNGHENDQTDELKSQNLALLQKLYESEQHIEYLRHENYEIKTQINALNTELYLKDETKNKLENMYHQLEAQLNESLKIQNQQVIDLQTEKRNIFKKTQEIEELKKNLRGSDDRIIELELKLSDKENENNILRTRISKLEAELTRIDKEYNKLRYKYSSGNNGLLTQSNDTDSQLTRFAKYQSASTASFTSPTQQNDNLSVKDNSRNSLVKSPLSSYSNFQSSSSYRNIVGDPREIITGTTKSPRLLQYENGNDKQQLITQSNNNSILSEKHLEYINHLEAQFDRLMKRKQQLDAEMTRLPHKATNTNMHVIKTSLENEISSVDKQLASIKLEMRKMNIIKSNH